MTPITGPATLPRRIARILATARMVREPLRVPASIDGDRLFSYWEGTLDADARREVEQHAQSCEECRRWLEEIGKMFVRRSSVPTPWDSEAQTTTQSTPRRQNAQ